MQVTDADKAQINRLLFKLVGGTEGREKTFERDLVYQVPRLKPGPNGEKYKCYSLLPDCFEDANAADRVLARLQKSGFEYSMGHHNIIHAWMKIFQVQDDGERLKIFADIDQSGDWKEALCLAVVERGEFCSECRSSVLPSQLCTNCCEVTDRINWRVRPELKERA